MAYSLSADVARTVSGPRRESVTLSTADGPMPALVSHPVGPLRGGVVVLPDVGDPVPAASADDDLRDDDPRDDDLHGADLHGDEGRGDYLAGSRDALARAGFRAITPALFGRSGGQPPFDPGVGPKAGPDPWPGLSPASLAEVAATVVDAAVALLADEGSALDRCALVGFGLGGSVVTYLAAHRPVAAAVSFGGAGLGRGRFGLPPLVAVMADLRAPWLGLFGELDPDISAAEVEAARAAAAGAAVATEVTRYPRAGHDFHRADSPGHEPGSAADAWARCVTWLDAHIPG
jgi:carboxymethylenebutenolidase